MSRDVNYCEHGYHYAESCTRCRREVVDLRPVPRPHTEVYKIQRYAERANGPEGENTKLSNPKDAIAGDRIPMDVAPDTARIAMAMALFEGALKYGKHNWRIAGVRASVYKAAFERHFMAWWNGEDTDAASGLPHLYKAIACLAIIIDAQAVGKLTDDRPPKAPVGKLLEDLQVHVKALREMHKDKSPRHYTIADT